MSRYQNDFSCKKHLVYFLCTRTVSSCHKLVGKNQPFRCLPSKKKQKDTCALAWSWKSWNGSEIYGPCKGKKKTSQQLQWNQFTNLAMSARLFCDRQIDKRRSKIKEIAVSEEIGLTLSYPAEMKTNETLETFAQAQRSYMAISFNFRLDLLRLRYQSIYKANRYWSG